MQFQNAQYFLENIGVRKLAEAARKVPAEALFFSIVKNTCARKLRGSYAEAARKLV